MKTKKRAMAAHIHGKKPRSPRRHVWLLAGIGVGLAAMIAIFGALVWYYQGRALPNVVVGNQSVANARPDAIRQVIATQVSALQITFDDKGQKTAVAAKDLGITVDTEATVQNALKVSQDPLKALQPWQAQTVPLVMVNDPGVLIDYAKTHYPSIFVDATEPAIVFNDDTKQFEVNPGKPGQGLDIKSFERALPELAKNPRGFTLKLSTQPVDPLLDETKLRQVSNDANDKIARKINFTLNGRVIYSAKPAETAGWFNFTPDTTTGAVKLDIDQAKVQQFLRDKVGPTVAAPPVDRKVVVDTNTGAQTVIQAGSAGSQLENIEALGKEVAAAIADNKELSKAVAITKAPFKTVTMSGAGKWIEVDLGRQRANLYVGNQQVQSFLISSGKAATPTQIGEFAIYSKRPVMTMTGTVAGDYFYLPNIKWVSFFDGGEAFHGTYWHHNFGHPMSHGCINLTEADAKVLYDFAPVGTKVIVHA